MQGASDERDSSLRSVLYSTSFVIHRDWIESAEFGASIGDGEVPADATLTALRPDGSFSFDAIDAVSARQIMRCMTNYGFTFDTVSAESTDFGMR